MEPTERDRAGLFDAAPCGLALLDLDQTIRLANDHFLELVGRPREAVAGGLKFYSLLSVAGRIFVQTRLQPELALAGRVEEIALDVVRPDGGRVPIILNAQQPRDEAGRPGPVRLALWRAAARRAYELEVPKARKAAEDAARVKADFLANVSHEIRTPLNGVLGTAGALARTPLDEAQRDMVDTIRDSAALLERLVADVLDVSKIESGALSLDPAPCRLAEALQGVLDVARLRCAEKGLAFAAEVALTEADVFRLDAVRLKQVLGHLTSNAVKFTDRGSVSVAVRLDPAPEGERLRLEVQDTGVGFDEAFGDVLFQRFQQVEAGLSRRRGGAGLGLAVVKALVDLMGGAIEVRSRPGEGSRFAVALPVERCADPASPLPAALPAPAEPEPDDDGRLRILLVEDNPTNQKVVRILLSASPVDLVVAEDGLQGLEAWRRERFDLVLMDMQMPVMDGLTATRAIRAEERAAPGRPRTPIAFLSANAMRHHQEEAAEAGADLHIAKPVTPETLFDGIERALACA